jgi:glycosyltransferase involved in cell wall biosynthesis
MKIVFIGQKGIPAKFGGVEKHVSDLAVKLVKLGHQVTVYTRSNYTDPNLTEYRGVKLISLPHIATKNLDAISHTFMACLNLIFKQRDVDIIHFHSIGPSSLIWLVRLFKPRTPVVSTFHTQCYFHKKWNGFAKAYLKFGEYVCCKFSNTVIVVSKTLKKYTEKKYNIEAINIPNGVFLPDMVEPNIIHEKWGLSRGSYILFVSRLIRHKGAHYLIDAYKKLETGKKLVIVGGGFFTDQYVSEIQEMAKDNDDIIVTGEQSGKVLEELFSNAYFFVQPSESEGLSIALLEAMSYRRMVLASNIPENKEVVLENGITFENKNTDDLASKMNFLLQNPELVKERGNAGYDHVAKYYNWNSIVNDVVNSYKNLLK